MAPEVLRLRVPEPASLSLRQNLNRRCEPSFPQRVMLALSRQNLNRMHEPSFLGHAMLAPLPLLVPGSLSGYENHDHGLSALGRPIGATLLALVQLAGLR